MVACNAHHLVSDLFQVIDASRTALVLRYRTLFNEGISRAHTPEPLILHKAAAWYLASFGSNATFSRPCLSFGWIMADKLAALKTRLPEDQPDESRDVPSFAHDLSDSVLEHFNAVMAPRLREQLSCFVPCAKQLAKLIKDQAFKLSASVEVHLSGSLSVFLSSESSDLNIAVSQLRHPLPVSCLRSWLALLFG